MSDTRSNVKMDYVGLDLETTGLNPDINKIISVTLIRYRQGVPIMEYTSLVNPGVDVPLQSTLVNCITTEEVKLAPSFKEIAQTIVDELNNNEYIVTYNGERFDLPFLINELNKTEVEYSIEHLKSIDVYRIAKDLYSKEIPSKAEDPENGGMSLANVYKHVTGFSLLDHHQSRADIIGTVEIMNRVAEDSNIDIKDYALGNYAIKGMDHTSLDDKFTIGKYQGMTIREAIKKWGGDKVYSYCKFLNEKVEIPINFSKKLLSDIHGLSKEKTTV